MAEYASDQVSMLDISTLVETDLPSLNKGRKYHSSLILNFQLFVMGGQVNGDEFLSSIESLDLQKN